jgi:hypothetical protein
MSRLPLIRLSLVFPALSLAACAGSPPAERLGNAAAPTALQAGGIAAVAARAKTITVDEIDNGVICELRKRPGSHIAQEYCYTAEQREGNAEQVQAILDQLERDQRAREAWEHAREAERQRAIMDRMVR